MAGANTNTSQTDTSSIHLGGVIKNGGGISIGGSLANGGSKFDDESHATGPQTGVDLDLKGMPMMLMNLDSLAKMQRKQFEKQQKQMQKQGMMCTQQFVSCPSGYDPRDPCNHTCLAPQ